MNKKNWIILLSLFAVIASGSIAFWLVEDGWTLMDAFYMTIISVTTVGYGEVHPLSPAGRIVAVIVLFSGLGLFGYAINLLTSYAVSGALEGSMSRRRAVAAIRKHRPNIIICGLGNRGHALASRVNKCVAIEPRKENIPMEILESDNASVLVGDAQANEIQRLARIETAEQVVVAAGNDSTNLEIAGAIRRFLGVSNVQVIAAVEDYVTRDSFADLLHRRGIHVLGFREQSLLGLARDMILEAVSTREDAPVDAPSLVLQVEDAFFEEVMRVFVMVFQIGGSKKLKISAFGVSPERKHSFETRFPEYSKCCMVEWHEKVFSGHASDVVDPDFAFFFSESETRVIELARSFARWHPEVSHTRIYACVEESGPATDLISELNCSDLGFRIVSLYDYLVHRGSLLNFAMEAEGKGLHEAYASNSTFEVETWDDISEFHRNSNRMAALQQDVYACMWEAYSASTERVQLLEYLARCEHSRWMSFHVMAGYRLDEKGVPNEERQRRKVHPNLVEYDELKEEDREKDRVTVRQLLDFTT